MHMHLVKPQLSFSIKAIESYVQSPIPIKLSLYSQFSPCGHLTIADKSQPPAEMHKEMTVINSCYYGLLLLWKCGCFHAPPPSSPSAMFHLFFFSHQSKHLSTSSKILTHIILSNITIKENKETILQLGAKRRISCLQLDLFLVREATLETLCLHSYILIIISYVQRKNNFIFSDNPPLLNLAIIYFLQLKLGL